MSDFSWEEGDRLVLAAGTSWSVSASGLDALVTLSKDDTLTLTGVSPGEVTALWFVWV